MNQNTYSDCMEHHPGEMKFLDINIGFTLDPHHV